METCLDTPTFNLKNQTDSLSREKADALLAIARIELFKRTPSVRTIEEIVTYGQPAKISVITLKDFLKNLHLQSLLVEETE